MDKTTMRLPSTSSPLLPMPASASLSSPFSLLPHLGKRFKIPMIFGPLFPSASEVVKSARATETIPPTPSKQQSQSIVIRARQRIYTTRDVVHDVYCCMFRITLDSTGATAALCYLPTRYQKVVEFYHTEIPVAYRNLGLGDLLVIQGFQWAEESRLLVIPTCPFVQRFLDQNDRSQCVVYSEREGMERLMAATTTSWTDSVE